MEMAEAERQRYEQEKLNLFYRVKSAFFEYAYLAQSIETTSQHLILLQNIEEVARTRLKNRGLAKRGGSGAGRTGKTGGPAAYTGGASSTALRKPQRYAQPPGQFPLCHGHSRSQEPPLNSPITRRCDS